MCKATQYNNLVVEIRKRSEFLKTELSNIDQLKTDIDHIIEMGTFDASNGYKLSKKLQEVLKQRRVIKNELESILPICKSTSSWQVRQPIKQKMYDFRKMNRENDGDFIDLIKSDEVLIKA